MSRLLPPNTTQLERLAAESGIATTELPVMLRSLWDPQTCPAPLLPWLAWAWSVDSWQDAWSDEQKRQTIAEALAVQQIKGTIGAVRKALAAIGIPSQVQEWFNQQPQGAPYTFRLILDVDQVPVTQGGIARLLEVVERTKSLRSHLETVIQRFHSRATAHGAVVAATGSETEVGYQAVTYASGEIAWGVITDAAYHGETSTAAALDRLHILLHSTTYRALLVQAARFGETATVAALDQLHRLLHTPTSAVRTTP